jgi:hypothetical protein
LPPETGVQRGIPIPAGGAAADRAGIEPIAASDATALRAVAKGTTVTTGPIALATPGVSGLGGVTPLAAAVALALASLAIGLLALVLALLALASLALAPLALLALAPLALLALLVLPALAIVR